MATTETMTTEGAAAPSESWEAVPKGAALGRLNRMMDHRSAGSCGERIAAMIAEKSSTETLALSFSGDPDVVRALLGALEDAHAGLISRIELVELAFARLAWASEHGALRDHAAALLTSLESLGNAERVFTEARDDRAELAAAPAAAVVRQ